MDVLVLHMFSKHLLLENAYGCWVQVYGDVWVHVYVFWMHVYAFWVHVYGSVGCMYAVIGCKVCGDVWVQSMRLLGAILITAESLPDSR